MSVLVVESGPMQGQRFESLLDYIDAQAAMQTQCRHQETRGAELVSGIATKQPHYCTAVICRSCGKVLASSRVRITHRAARLLMKRVAP